MSEDRNSNRHKTQVRNVSEMVRGGVEQNSERSEVLSDNSGHSSLNTFTYRQYKLYLETGAVPIRFLISSRRKIYLQNILKRDDDELVKKIYKAESINPTPGDLVELLKGDFEIIAEAFDEKSIVKTSIKSYKEFIKSRIRAAALKHLNQIKQTHSKVKEFPYEKLETQSYLISPLFSNNSVNLLFPLRSRTVDCKLNFKNRYKEMDVLCPLCVDSEDSQQHMLEYVEVRKR